MDIWQKILAIALHAPSPHNVQPWRVKILNETQAELCIDSTRTLPKEDVTGSFIILTMGIFIETLDLLARRENLQINYQLFHEPEWYAPAILKTVSPTLLSFAKLRLEPAVAHAPTPSQYDEELFLKRRTSRLSLLPQKVPAEVTTKLQQIAAEFNHHYVEITDSGKIDRIINRNITAVFDDLNSLDYQEELVSWFRFSDRESEEKRDGLDYRCMNTSQFNFRLSAIAPWLLRIPVFRQMMHRVYRRQLGRIPTIGVLAGEFWDPRAAFDAGRCLMRFWLETAVHDLYLHPYGNLVTNKKAAAWWRAETNLPDAWLIFKIGYSPEPPQSYRLPLEKILVT